MVSGWSGLVTVNAGWQLVLARQHPLIRDQGIVFTSACSRETEADLALQPRTRAASQATADLSPHCFS